jgi:hypothetical protein
MLAWFAPGMFEPTDPARCEAVRVVGLHVGGRGSEEFIVESANVPSRHWQVGRYKTPFPRDYRGPAALLLTRGRWTGSDHLKLVSGCSQ